MPKHLADRPLKAQFLALPRGSRRAPAGPPQRPTPTPWGTVGGADGAPGARPAPSPARARAA